MKKIIITSIAILGVVAVKAQNATLNVRLKPIQTLVVNNAQKIVNLDYVTKDDYANGVSSLNADHLNIFSTGGFQVKVKSANSALQNGNKNIQANTIQIKATAGSDAVNGAQYAQNVQLSANETTLVSSSNGGVDKKISIEYKGAGANTYLDNYIAGQDPTVYTTELTYTIVSQ
ncbi:MULTISPECIES: hypothetical protein [Chryseobacterium]|jgi:hypothetical protein|uniref:Peptidoglycan-binding protein LysM n=2 Tax=Chryseobacterium aquaticum TaxID=452084 RepID=A0A0Q3HRU1_9FLAO|nr:MULTISPECIES: hypothetical protein [Chryseobacterium]KNB60636.1 hypothetical protein AC804_15800 [Chryseobacterium sp. Hurlbut01]KQK25480.1 hypothetical protein AR438_07660 [Chryseobacterium aquaticum]KUJ56815.1 hypothetical protein AR686_09695 [Chryseobacterium aquaticum subsp. greenlandense]NMR34281.1 hypothetical protein [Chryseobacterium aquaticum]NRQ46354.1 hypothetical protein [Chryseobacterium sp. C-204]